MKPSFTIKRIIGIIWGLSVFSISPVWADHFIFTPVSVSTMFLYGDTFTINGENAQQGDEIAVYDVQSTICGKSVVQQAGYFILTIYEDDINTPEDEGALINEPLRFVIWDQSKQIELPVEPSMLIQSPFTYDSVDIYPPAPHHPPVFEGNNMFYGLDIVVEKHDFTLPYIINTLKILSGFDGVDLGFYPSLVDKIQLNDAIRWMKEMGTHSLDSEVRLLFLTSESKDS
ncbi:MAG: hypothetical protein HQK75_09625, partial [Candidatus Magnetomorum sp.]|nr:hypothetical protein [Candidatus Magnetomorum sp.]